MYDEPTDEAEEMTPEQRAHVNTILYERDRDNFQRAIAERIEADGGLLDEAAQAAINKAFQERAVAKGAKTAAQWALVFEDVYREHKNAPPPSKPWKTMSDEEFAKEEAAIKAEKRAAIESAQKAKRESLDKAADKVMKGDDDKAPDWLGMSDEEFEARDKKRADIARRRLIETSR